MFYANEKLVRKLSSLAMVSIQYPKIAIVKAEVPSQTKVLPLIP